MSNVPVGLEDLEANRQLIIDTGRSFRRMQSNEEFDAKGVRTIWHRGRTRSEMLSWEDRGQQIVRQELCFFGMVVLFERGKPTRTGVIPMNEETTGHGMSAADVQMDPEPSELTLEYAISLLKGMEKRDFYTQHMIKVITDAQPMFGEDERTDVFAPQRYARNGGTEKSDAKPRRFRHSPWLIMGWTLWAALIITALVRFVMWI